MHLDLSAVEPNGKVAKGTVWKIAIGQIIFLATVWFLRPPTIIPSPSEVLAAWADLLRNGLLVELQTSFLTNLEALGLATVISLGVSYLTVIPAMRPIATAMASARNFGVTGFVVIFTVALGAGHGLRIGLLSFCIVPFFVASMSSVVASIPREEWDHARVLRMKGWRAVWEIVILGKADQALEALRQNAAMGWMVLTMVEGLSRSEGGLGVMMLDENKHFRLAAVFAIQATIFAVGVAQDASLAWLRRTLCPYADIEKERA